MTIRKSMNSFSFRQTSAAGERSSLGLGLALGVSALAWLPPLARSAEPGSDPRELATVKVVDTAIDPNPNAEPGVPYKARTSGDERHTRPLAETPQSITVLTQAAIADSGNTDLKQILAAQPGITLGTGENGNAFGDRYIIRGQEARSDVFVDGLRDPGMTTRESFAIEQLEISRGPNSSFAGRGTAGGAINAITKQATNAYDFGKVSAGFGTDRHARLTVDVNHAFGERFGLRANALYGDEDVPDRKPAYRRRGGLALSGLYAPSDRLNIVADYYGLRARDNPDLGGYLVGTTPPGRTPADNVPVYAQQNDFLKSTVDTGTVRVRYEFNDQLWLTSRTRYGTADNGYGTTGAAAAQPRYDGATGTAFPTGTGYLDAGHTGWQDVRYFAHQTNLRWDRSLAGREHELIFSVEYTDQRVLSAAGSGSTGYSFISTGAFNCKTTAGVGSNNAYCFTTVNGTPLDATALTGRVYLARQPKQQDWHARTAAAAVMDTVDLTRRLSLFAGLRADRFDLSLQRFNQATGALTGDYGYDDTLVNGHIGLTFRVRAHGIIYASVASAEDVNGGEADSGTNSGYGGLVLYNGSAAGARPERSLNLELGTKWNLLDERLLLTGALFQIRKSDVMEGANYDVIGTFNSGRNRVQGVELGLVGNLREALTAQVGVTLMHSEVLESATPANVGKPLSNFANRSASAQLKYAVTKDLALGGTVRYESDRCGGQPDTAAVFVTTAAGDACNVPVPSFVVFDALASWQVNKDFGLHLNVSNLTNRDYYTAAYRSGSFLYKGDARAIRLTLTYEF